MARRGGLSSSWWRLWLACVMTMMILLAKPTSSSSSSSIPVTNPFQVLGIEKLAAAKGGKELLSDNDVRRQYHKLCLQYHPDKNRHLSPKERKRCEQIFKQIHKAYEQIDTQQKRRRFLAASTFSTTTNQRQSFYNSQRSNNASRGAHSATSDRTSSRYYSSSFFTSPEDFYRAFAQQRRQQYPSSFPYTMRQQQTTRQPVGIYVNGIELSQILSSFGFLFNNNNNNKSPPRFIYNKRISLLDLYRGKSNVLLSSHDILQSQSLIWNRWKALFSGGRQLIWQRVITSLVLSWPLSMTVLKSPFLLACMTFFVFCGQLPRLTLRQEEELSSQEWIQITIPPGSKEGTKIPISFQHHDDDEFHQQEQESNVELCILIEEEPDKIFERRGDNLYTVCTISQDDARHGCTLWVPTLKAKQNNNKSETLKKKRRRRWRRRGRDQKEEEELHENVVEYHLNPNEITASGQTICIPGHGWPIIISSSKDNEQQQQQQEANEEEEATKYGDLIVTIRLAKK